MQKILKDKLIFFYFCYVRDVLIGVDDICFDSICPIFSLVYNTNFFQELGLNYIVILQLPFEIRS
jgi:hypothetical protein